MLLIFSWGDYFSPYGNLSFDECKINYLEILEYKKQHPETILLIGNHDAEYWKLNEPYSKHDWVHEKEICQLFEDNTEYFQVAHSIENKVLVTHAGVSYVWYDIYKNHFHKVKIIDRKNNLWKDNREMEKFEIFSVMPDEVAEFVNSLWETHPNAFAFKTHANFDDNSGTTDTHSPIWIRPKTLKAVNLFSHTDYWQIFGHTQMLYQYGNLNLTNSIIKNILIDKKNKLACADYQSHGARSIIYDSENDKVYLHSKVN